MKKTLFVLCLITFFSGAAFAQLDTVRSNKNEFSIGYGHMPSSSFRYRPGCMFYPETDNIGAIYVTYTRRLTQVIGIGLTFCYDPIHLDYYGTVNGNNTLICKVRENSFTLIPHLKINWLNTKYVNLYSKVGFMGFQHVTYKQEEYYPEIYEVNPAEITHYLDGFQITPVGVEVGTKRCAGFIQCGIGMEGIISIGFRYGIKDKE